MADTTDTILILLLAGVGFWIVMRVRSGQPVIPTSLENTLSSQNQQVSSSHAANAATNVSSATSTSNSSGQGATSGSSATNLNQAAKPISTTYTYKSTGGTAVKVANDSSVPQWQINQFANIQNSPQPTQAQETEANNEATQSLDQLKTAIANQFGSSSQYKNYTGYLHVALPGGNWSDVYVQNGQSYGINL